MSTWQIFSDPGKDFRWEVSGRIIRSKLDNDRNIAASPPLPSMADLLVQGLPKLSENGSGRDGKAPMFTTGSGKSMVLKESSFAKAFSVLGDEIEDRTFNADGVLPRSNGCGQSNSLFQTGSGKTVNVSSAGLLRAKKLLGLEEDVDHCSFQSFQQPRRVSESKECFGWQSLTNMENKESIQNNGSVDSTSAPTHSIKFKTGSTGSKLGNANDSTAVPSRMFNSASKSPPIKFHTAGGRSLSVSSDALKRARSLLGDPELGTSFDEADVNDLSFSSSKERTLHHTSRIHTAGGRSISVSSDALKRARSLLGDPELATFFDEVDANDLSFSSLKERRFCDASGNKENDFATFSSCQGVTNNKHTPHGFISPLKSSKQVRSFVNSENITSGSNLIKKFDAAVNASVCGLTDSMEMPLSNKLSESNLLMSSGTVSRINSVGRSYSGPLTDISNSIPSPLANNKQIMNEKRRLARTSTVSPFKRPRTSKFSTPLKRNGPLVLNGLPPLSSESLCCKRTVSTRYPFRVPRIYIKEYFGVPPSECSLLESMSAEVKEIKPGNADKYMFRDESGIECIGAEAFRDMLVRSGALMQYVSKEWVRNHYKWIVWKLGSYERCYLAKYAGKFLTISAVLEELKYRYEREINHGHRSAIKRIMEGDTPPSTMLVLCISAIHLCYEPKIETPMVANGAQNSGGAKVELTDGWYSMDAVLDVLLSKQLAAGKLFVGQKLRIWGAKLCGWVGPVSPLEASKTINLLLNINGTYRAHWADRLGFCMAVGDPLAFKCIKSGGGLVPRTLVGITRIYPVLYKERLLDGGSVVRSERMEGKIMQLYHSRRSIVAEGIISEYSNPHIRNDSEGEEGAKILKILESAAEPEVIMAEMSPEQLNSFAAYKAKLEASRQSEMQKSIEKALTDAGLSEREVTPFMRVRVVGLTSRSCGGKGRPKEGIITIWNPTEKQKNELVEGQAYSVEGLLPLHSDSEILYLHARGSTTKWKPLSPLGMEHFEPFFSPRKSILLSNLGEIPLSSEFDIAALVVYVGEVYMAAHQKKQWVFVTDDSLFDSQLEDLSNSLLAISFSSRCANDSYEPINSNLVGSTVGFCNVIKKAKDQMNHLWVAEATENSTYFLDFKVPICSHLRNAAVSVETWAKISPSIIDKLREKVIFILGNCKA